MKIYNLKDSIHVLQSLLEAHPEGMSFDYETSSLDMWHPAHEIPLGFSVASLDAVSIDDSVYFDTIEDLSESQKSEVLKLLKKHRPWVYNAQFEINVTWSWLGEFVKFNDVYCMLKAWGYRTGLKATCVNFLKVEDWGDVWDVVSFTQECFKFIRARQTNTYSRIAAFSKSFEEFDEKLSEACKVKTPLKYEQEFILKYMSFKKSGLSWELVRSILDKYSTPTTKTGGTKKNPWTVETIDLENITINLSHLPLAMVAEYCNKDVFYTSKLKRFLDEHVKDSWYQIYLKQTYLSSYYKAYGICWSYPHSETLENEFTTDVLASYERLTKNELFKLHFNADVPEEKVLTAIAKFENARVSCLDERSLDSFSAWYNPGSTSQSTYDTFYESIGTPRVRDAVFAYKIYLDFQKFDKFIDPLTNKSYLEGLKVANLKEGLIRLAEAVKREKPQWESDLRSTIFKAKEYFNSLKGSMDSASLEKLYSSMKQCLDIDIYAKYEDHIPEFRLLFDIKLIKKHLKSINTYINGSVGRGRVAPAYYSGNMTIPCKRWNREGQPATNLHILQSEFSENSADTKRWRSPIHCLTAETTVLLTDGRHIRMDDLLKEYLDGKTHYVYTVTESGSIEVENLTNVQLSGRVDELIELELSNGEVVRCTPNHRFVTTDLQFIEAQDITPETDLLEIKFEHSATGHLQLKQLDDVELVHRISDRYNERYELLRDHSVDEHGRNGSWCRHHVDFNKLNNDPSNVQRYGWVTHYELHKSPEGHIAQWKTIKSKLESDPIYHEKFMKTRQYNGRISMNKLWESKSFREDHARRNKLRVELPHVKEGHTARMRELWKKPYANHLNSVNLCKLVWSIETPVSWDHYDQLRLICPRRVSRSNVLKSKFKSIQDVTDILTLHKMMPIEHAVKQWWESQSES